MQNHCHKLAKIFEQHGLSPVEANILLKKNRNKKAILAFRAYHRFFIKHNIPDPYQLAQSLLNYEQRTQANFKVVAMGHGVAKPQFDIVAKKNLTIKCADCENTVPVTRGQTRLAEKYGFHICETCGEKETNKKVLQAVRLNVIQYAK